MAGDGHHRHRGLDDRSQRKFKRNWGFWLFLLSNVLWIIWGVADGAYALIVLQFALAALNIRGAVKNQARS